MTIDQGKLHALAGKMIGEIGAAANGVLLLIGDKLGLFRAIRAHGPLTPEELAQKTGTNERYICEWLAAQAATGLVEYDPIKRRFFMSPEQIALAADEDSPVFMGGGFESLAAVFAGEERLTRAFKTGEGIGWDQHCNCLFCGTERFFRTGYKAHLVDEWLPALEGVVAKLKRGARVADIGCGHGASTIIMAERFPESEFVGIDVHQGSIVEARAKAGTLRNVRFEVGRAQEYEGANYDLVTIFDALHDMGDPIGAVAHIRKTMARDGTLMVVEPMAADRLEDNLNPISRSFYAFSTQICVPASMSQRGRAALGAQAGEKRITETIKSGGFSHVRRATATPFNMILEARL
jgi:ubiquinone/menaquinone biosynthesis C-methylase UbiE